jgi:hypothetical protein
MAVVKNTIFYKTPGAVDGSFRSFQASFVSEQQFSTWLNGGSGRTVTKVPLDSTLDGDNAALEVAVLTLEEALNALSDDKSFFLVEAGYRLTGANGMKKIKSANKKRAKAIKMKMTLSIAQDTAVRKQLVNLQVVNAGAGVKF